jgi:Xaa-Pro aminopeptidase
VSSDAHSSEYVADRWKAREWISGFDGSAGTAVVTLDKALLWTDSRYWLAADKVLADNGYELMKDGAADTPSIVEWLCANMDEGAVVGVDATVCSIAEFNAWSAALSSCGLSLDSSGQSPDVPR